MKFTQSEIYKYVVTSENQTDKMIHNKRTCREIRKKSQSEVEGNFTLSCSVCLSVDRYRYRSRDQAKNTQPIPLDYYQRTRNKSGCKIIHLRAHRRQRVTPVSAELSILLRSSLIKSAGRVPFRSPTLLRTFTQLYDRSTEISTCTPVYDRHRPAKKRSIVSCKK